MDLEDLVKKANEKEEKKESVDIPVYQDNSWIWITLILLLLMDFPKKEEKQEEKKESGITPTIVICMGDDE